MSKYRNACPPELLDDDDEYDGYSFEPTTSQENSQQQIKIVDQIGTSCGINRANFDISLDQNTQQWFDRICQYWKQFKKSPMLSNTLQQFYSNSSNPFIHSLKFFANCCDYPNPKANSFSYTVLEELSRYKKTLHSMGIKADVYLDDNTKMVAFNFLKKSGQATAFKLVVDTFELVQSKYLFVPEIRELITEKHYKEAGQIACDLQLYNEFTMDDFLIPLILEDKLSIFEEYLDKAQHLRSSTIQLLDSFLNRDKTVREMCSEYINKYDLHDVKYEKLHKKPISKLITRLMKKYHLPENIAPNMKTQKDFGALHFILRKNYVDKSLNQASFEEMVKDTIGADNKELQLELVNFCLNYGSPEDAVSWTKFYNLPLDSVPGTVRAMVQGVHRKKKIPSGWDTDDDDGWNEPSSQQKTQEVEETLHTLSLDPSRMILVNTVSSYQTMIRDLRYAKIVAFDTEWKPTIHSNNDVSLIQLAKRDLIYLVDVITLMKLLSDHDWSLLGRWVFNNDEILKLGFAHATDISMLLKFSALGMQNNQQSNHSYLDLQELWRKVSCFPNFKFPFHEDLQSQSLSNLVKLCFGKKLDKSNQFSNWQQRPLRQEQISYAALDAYCLFEIFDIIGRVITNMGINYDELINNILMENKKDIASLAKKESRQKPNNTYCQQADAPRRSINVRGIKFVTDTMLASLGRVLRQVGIDTVILKGSNVDHEDCIKISQTEDRIVLTASKPLQIRYQKYTKLGCSYLVIKNHNELLGLEEIIKHFKINVQRQNVFSRCMLCNCDDFIVASKLDMIRIKYQDSEIPDELKEFVDEPQKYSHIEFPENKELFSWRRYVDGQNTKYGAKIEATMADGTLKIFQTFYICQCCGKNFWDGGHYLNNCGGKLDFIFNLFPDAEN